ncbi:MAG: SRPBCC domain-containing protein [Bacteroidota bacterium]
MKKLNFSIKINSPRQKVWEVLWGDSTYRTWTSVFSEGSHAVTDWKEGSKVLFLNGQGDGMYSFIDRKVTPEVMSFKHIGDVIKGVEQPATYAQKGLEGKETYYLKDAGPATELSVELDAPEDFAKYFEETFPKSLEKVKELAEI